ncbi:MAG: hypothetical protein M3Y05_07400 [Gemmatimonadota bacterium]|nr:hypothetical protein [Gemmatimonadota bacterium]
MKKRNLTIWPTGLNVFEAMKSGNAVARAGALANLGCMAGNRRLLPLPIELLRENGAALLRGEASQPHDPSIIDRHIRHPHEVKHKQIEIARRWLDDRQARLEDAHETIRPDVMAELRQSGERDRWQSIANFFDAESPHAVMSERLMLTMWKNMPLPYIEIDAVRANEAWRLYFEGISASFYGRNV